MTAFMVDRTPKCPECGINAGPCPKTKRTKGCLWWVPPRESTVPDEGTNLYRGSHPLFLHSGRFWRCRHGSTLIYSCWRCGVFHPVAYLKDRIALLRSRY